MIKNRVFEQMAKAGIRRQTELAERIGITKQNAGRIVNGDIRAIRFETLNSLCRVLGCQTSELFEYIPDTEQAELPLTGRR